VKDKMDSSFEVRVGQQCVGVLSRSSAPWRRAVEAWLPEGLLPEGLLPNGLSA
jgi:hypothetical protein